MRLIIALAAVAIAAASTEFTPDDILLETQSDIAALKKKGATEADCKDLAKTTCKETVSERARSQKIILSVSDSTCHTRGQAGVTKALAHYKRTKKTWMSMKVKVTVASNVFVKINSQKFSSLKPGKCGFLFASRYYLSAKAKYDRAVKIEIAWKGRVSEAHKSYLRFVRIAAQMVKKCRCHAKVTAMTTWKLQTKKSVIARQNKAYAKCKMMQCVLAGTKLSSRKCKGSLKPLVKKVLSAATRKASCTSAKTPFSSCRAKSFTHYACSKCGASGTGGTIISLKCPKKCGWGKWHNTGNSGASSIVISNCGKSAELTVAHGANGARPSNYYYKSNVRGASMPRNWNLPKKSVVWNCGRLPNGRRQGHCLPTGNDNIRSYRFKCC